jgi:TatD DNase family protein
MLDSHCHLDRYGNAQEIAAEASRRGVFVVAMTNLPTHFKVGLPYVRHWPRVRLALGLHPLAAEDHEREIPEFERCLSQSSFVGEIGLDFSRHGRATAERQLQSFRVIARLLARVPKFVSLHSRGAEREVLEILTENGVKCAVFHWYSGPVTVLESLLQAGHSLSVNPAMTVSTKGQEIIRRLPRDRVLTESDGPHVKVGRAAARPWDVQLVETYLAGLWGTSIAEVRAQMSANFMMLLNRCSGEGQANDVLRRC